MPPLTGSHNTPKRRVMTGVTPAPPTPTKPFKAVAAFVLTFLGTLIASVQGKKEFTELTLLEWLIIVGSALVTSGTVWGVTNPAKTNRGV